ncbi:hypothetical protein NUM3379_16160 [Kineococcus sp. NUM-3379]
MDRERLPEPHRLRQDAEPLARVLLIRHGGTPPAPAAPAGGSSSVHPGSAADKAADATRGRDVSPRPPPPGGGRQPMRSRLTSV